MGYPRCVDGLWMRSNVSDGKERIAAVVVTYNRKDLLGQCLDSLLRQSYPLDALYVIDNCSTDGTQDYVLGWGGAPGAKDAVDSVDRVDGAGPAGRRRRPLGPHCPPAAAPTGLVPRAEISDEKPSETVRPIPLPSSADRRLEVHYVRMPQNTGGAGGFHEGMKRAVDAGFDWLWLMDDDLLTSPDALEVLVQKKKALESSRDRSFILNSLVLARDQPDSDRLPFPLQELAANGQPRRGIYHWRLSEVQSQIKDGLYRWACPFNGTFVPARAVAQVGLPNKDFFIRGDEKDFLWRLARRFDMYTAVDSKVFHPVPRDAGFDGKQYYSIRNMIVVNRHFDLTTLRNLRLILLSLARG
ncbi:MAG: hypothetical protein A2Y77_06730, partial [Planctomycetes bacterium RBG_13_62_9]